MYITRRALRNAGLEVQLDKMGLSIQGTGKLPEPVQEHVHEIAKEMEFSPMDHDRLMEQVCSIGVWSALRGCPTEI